MNLFESTWIWVKSLNNWVILGVMVVFDFPNWFKQKTHLFSRNFDIKFDEFVFGSILWKIKNKQMYSRVFII